MCEPPFEGGALHLAVDLTEEDLARSVLVRNPLVLLGAVSDTDGLKLTARGLARIGAVACQRTSPVGVIRTPLKACIAPRPGNNVSLAGVPRRVSKLHRPWPGGGLPARANSSLVSRGAETTTAAPTTPSVEDVDAPYGPSGALRAVWTSHGEASLPHHLPTLAALAHTSSPLLQQRFMGKATSPASGGSRITPSSQEIRRRNNPVRNRDDSTRESEKQHRLVAVARVGEQWEQLALVAGLRLDIGGDDELVRGQRHMCPMR